MNALPRVNELNEAETPARELLAKRARESWHKGEVT